MVNKVFIGLIIFAVLAIFFFIIAELIIRSASFSANQDSYVDYQTCLKSKDITLYINTNNPSEVLGNIEIANSLNHIKVKNCYNAKTECESKNIVYFPTWIVNGNKIERDIKEEDLEKYSGCKNG